MFIDTKSRSPRMSRIQEMWAGMTWSDEKLKAEAKRRKVENNG